MKRYIRTAGYHGYSMSNNAVDAYENGEKPLSKWAKTDILSELHEIGYSDDVIQIAKNLSLAELKSIFLYKSSWHHTSKMYNRTNFYSVNPDVPAAEITSYLNKLATPDTEIRPKYRYYKIFYGKPCYAIGDSFKYFIYTDNGITKVRGANVRYDDILEWYDDIPEGTEDIFNKLIEAYENN